MPYLPSMADEELMAYAYQTADPIHTTDLESELLRRLELVGDCKAVSEAVDEYGLDASGITTLGEAMIGTVDYTVALLRALSDRGVESPALLRSELEKAQAVDSLLDELDNPIDVLNTLLREAQSDNAICVIDSLINFLNTVNTL